MSTAIADAGSSGGALLAFDGSGDGGGDGRPVERAYRVIRQAILGGVLPAGGHLGEERLSALSGTSRTPVREALRRLVAEGLAQAEGRHRFVSRFTYEEVAIMFDVRAQLEGYAAGIAATRITPAETDRLEALIAEIDAVNAAGGPAAESGFDQLNTLFHLTIIAAARSPQLRAMIMPAFNVPLPAIKKFLWDQSINPRRSNEQHRDIVAAMRARNAQWATTAMQGHIVSTKPLNHRAAKPAAV